MPADPNPISQGNGTFPKPMSNAILVEEDKVVHSAGKHDDGRLVLAPSDLLNAGKRVPNGLNLQRELFRGHARVYGDEDRDHIRRTLVATDQEGVLAVDGRIIDIGARFALRPSKLTAIAPNNLTRAKNGQQAT
jgi:hypothetical protein